MLLSGEDCSEGCRVAVFVGHRSTDASAECAANGVDVNITRRNAVPISDSRIRLRIRNDQRAPLEASPLTRDLRPQCP